MAVVKDAAYGHGAVAVAQIALECGASWLGVSTLDEALELRDAFPDASILLLGERPPEELPWCVEQGIDCCVQHGDNIQILNRLAEKAGVPARIHLKIDTGMSRYGVRWTEAPALLKEIHACNWLRLTGVMSHFAQSDEADKAFALLQSNRFRQVLSVLEQTSMPRPLRHLCNSGGFLDLPQAHFDMVRCGILPLGVYPSMACRRLPGIRPVMRVKTRLATIQPIEPGDTVGYGMRWTSPTTRRIGVLPIGYGDGYPRLRNCGWVLIHGQRAPIIGANAMDAIMVDLTNLPQARLWDDVVLLGTQGTEVISVHDVATWGQTVSYNILTGWRDRLPRLYLGSTS